jgi:signal transduction histidine kinase
LIYVINDLLDLRKTEEGGPWSKASFDLKATITEATDMFRNNAKSKNIAYEHSGLPPLCIGDQHRVRQVISNITASAIQNTPQGRVEIEAFVAARPDKDDADVKVAVSDTGAGMNSKQYIGLSLP